MIQLVVWYNCNAVNRDKSGLEEDEIMKCDRCESKMFKAKMVGAQFVEILLVNKKKGIFESEKRSTVSCYVCPECSHIELVADHPNDLQID